MSIGMARKAVGQRDIDQVATMHNIVIARADVSRTPKKLTGSIARQQFTRAGCWR